MRRALFVAAGLLFALPLVAAAGDPAPVARADSLQPAAGGVELIYFHATLRCETCLGLEAHIERCLRAEFAAELAAGRLVWRSLNYEVAEGSALHAALDVRGSELVIRRLGAAGALPIRSVWQAAEAAAVCDSLAPLVTEYLGGPPDAATTSGR
jgi:hypothetical protein